MKLVKEYFETSSLHGLVFINDTNHPLAKFFWVCVVVTGFIGAGIMIEKSNSGWYNNQVSTTIETLPITDVKIPLITVCPPKVFQMMTLSLY